MELLKPDFYYIPRVVADDVEAHEAFVFGVVYWFVKMKEGRCFASNDRIAQALPYKSSPSSVANALGALEEKGFIERVFSNKAKRNRVEIKCMVSTEVQPTGYRRSTSKLKGVQPTGEQTNTRDKEQSNSVAPRRAYSLERDFEEGERQYSNTAADLDAATDLWRPINPLYKNWYRNNKTERHYIDLLLSEEGVEWHTEVCSILEHTNDRPYFSTITKPSVLYNKRAELKAQIQKHQNQINQPKTRGRGLA